MKRVRLEVAYDGTCYCGWQIQPNVATIEGMLNKHLSELLNEPIEVIGASRTDAGVHALQNIAVFDTKARIPAEKISYALNQRLPEDIRIQRSEEVAPDFHPRHVNSIKTYHYKIEATEFPTPINRLYTHFTYVPLDLSQMQKAATYFIGTHDFKSFCSIHTQVETTVRTITSLSVEKTGNIITIAVSGTGFLYNMVRIIAGTLMDVGRGNTEPEQIPGILEKMDRNAAGPTAPAKGLLLYSYQIEK